MGAVGDGMCDYCQILGANCLHEDENKVKDTLGIANVTTEDKYLGLPTLDGRMSKDKFQTMKRRLVKKFNNWMERNMSSGAKEVIIKSVAQAMATYMMSIFKLPTGLCDELTHIVRNFWWGDEPDHRKVHWIV
jgi:hypothetical protein